MNDTMDTTLTGSSVSVNNPLHHSPPAPHWGAPGGGGGGSPRFNSSHHQQHSQTPTSSAAFVCGKTKSTSAGGGNVVANSVTEQLRPPDTGGSASVEHSIVASSPAPCCNKDDSSACGNRRPPSSVVTASSGAVTVINVQHGGTCKPMADKVHPDDGECFQTRSSVDCVVILGYQLYCSHVRNSRGFSACVLLAVIKETIAIKVTGFEQSWVLQADYFVVKYHSLPCLKSALFWISMKQSKLLNNF